ncbi:histidinol dehydrogenase [Candidatus Magnetaquicoccus inordinatus]|uniref:histidinol dehydrogenase n=1 Tax=Candidatus Magnetaquicoccus inordinatus TaxID=2496818 RepID=UPI00102BB8AD|nr:histidinol dehydrogenase [Candidatus Magnetaquicoccus inordinatus]
MNSHLIARLDSRQADFQARYQRLLQWDSERILDVEQRVADIIHQVRQEGDAALIRLTQQFDRILLHKEQLAFSEQEIDTACQQLPTGDMEALQAAAERIRAYHLWQMPAMGIQRFQDATGMQLGQRLTAIERAGLYVPGGLASYPSSVLMNAIPAQVAGVQELIMVVPTPDGTINPLVLAAARVSGVQRIFRVGGAQAVAALAYGTQSIPRVDKIVGPGNIYVATAKRQVFGQVGIDMIAGPSEILVIADQESNPEWLAADLLSQAEHDESAQAILITDSQSLADAVEEQLHRLLQKLSRQAICRIALANRGALITVPDLPTACQLASQAAPEHLELSLADPEAALPMIHNAGAIFLGRYTPEAIGDYVAGPNHVLPTSGTARFSSPLGVYDFIKRSSLLGGPLSALQQIGPIASRLANRESLTAHQYSVDCRLESAS